jgi:branched-chain amino acid transport system ATP-binding protein
MSNSVPLLHIEQLTRRFGGLTAVGGLDLVVEHGELVSVIGPNGAGKTTLFNLITALDVPDTGRIMLDGQPIAGLSRRGWQRWVLRAPFSTAVYSAT